MNLFGGLLFGTIGWFALISGKRRSSVKTMGIGVILMAYPYFVSNPAVMYLLGAALVVVLLSVRD